MMRNDLFCTTDRTKHQMPSKRMTRLTLVLLVCLALSACNPAQTSIPAETMRNASQLSLFGDPNWLCTALDAEGLNTRGWRESSDGRWACNSKMVDFGTVAPGMALPGNLAYYVWSKTNRPDEIRIKININNASERDLAFEKLTHATNILLSRVGQPMPPGLAKALADRKAAVMQTEFGTAALEFQDGKIDSFVVVFKDGSAHGNRASVTGAESK